MHFSWDKPNSVPVILAREWPRIVTGVRRPGSVPHLADEVRFKSLSAMETLDASCNKHMTRRCRRAQAKHCNSRKSKRRNLRGRCAASDICCMGYRQSSQG